MGVDSRIIDTIVTIVGFFFCGFGLSGQSRWTSDLVQFQIGDSIYGGVGGLSEHWFSKKGGEARSELDHSCFGQGRRSLETSPSTHQPTTFCLLIHISCYWDPPPRSRCDPQADVSFSPGLYGDLRKPYGG